MMTDCRSVDELKPDIVNEIKYNQIMEEDKWRVKIIKEILDIKYGGLTIPEGWTTDELEEILKFACVS